MTAEPLVLVVTLEVRRTAETEFRRFETAAAEIMTSHGGRIERVIELDAESAEILRELHIVEFPNESSFQAYRGDPRLVPLTALRHLSIISTAILRGRNRPTYHA